MQTYRMLSRLVTEHLCELRSDHPVTEVVGVNVALTDVRQIHSSIHKRRVYVHDLCAELLAHAGNYVVEPGIGGVNHCCLAIDHAVCALQRNVHYRLE